MSGSTGPSLATEKPAIEQRYSEYQKIVSRALEVFGSEAEATRWLSNPSQDFASRTPLQAFTDDGSQRVLEVLGKIEHGVYF